VVAVVASVVGCGGGGSTTDAAPAGAGQRLVDRLGCATCHTIDGTTSTGPTWKGLAGSPVELADHRTVTADHAYLVRSILDPDADTVAGFPAGLMHSAIGPLHVTAAQADAIAHYIESLR
jgi:mono/diheme cytochrome c family protein